MTDSEGEGERSFFMRGSGVEREMKGKRGFKLVSPAFCLPAREKNDFFFIPEKKKKKE